MSARHISGQLIQIVAIYLILHPSFPPHSLNRDLIVPFWSIMFFSSSSTSTLLFWRQSSNQRQGTGGCVTSLAQQSRSPCPLSCDERPGSLTLCSSSASHDTRVLSSVTLTRELQHAAIQPESLLVSSRGTCCESSYLNTQLSPQKWEWIDALLFQSALRGKQEETHWWCG